MSEHGGARPGAGRKQGQRNKATVEREIRAEHGIQAALETGVMPLDLLLTVMRGGPEADAISDRQFQAARDAAPYMHAKLAAAAVAVRDVTPQGSPADTRNLLKELLLGDRGYALIAG